MPAPERFAIHKLIVSQLRTKTSSKPEKDLRQAATLIEAVVERFPGAIENALQAAPKSALKHIERAAEPPTLAESSGSDELDNGAATLANVGNGRSGEGQ